MTGIFNADNANVCFKPIDDLARYPSSTGSISRHFSGSAVLHRFVLQPNRRATDKMERKLK